MSLRREDIQNAIWGDEDFGALSPTAKLLYLWTFTNPRCGMAGLYKLRRGFAAVELGIDQEAEQQAWDELATADFAYFEGGVVFVRTRVKHLRTRGEKIATAIERDVEQIAPDHPLRRRFLEVYAETDWLPLRRLTDESSISLPTSLDRAESDDPSEGPRATATARDRAGEGEVENVGNGNTPPVVPPAADAEDIRIFEVFKRLTSRDDAKLTEKRLELVQKAREHSTPDELCEAISRWEESPYHNGTKLGNGPLNDLRHLIPDRETVEELLECLPSGDAFRQHMKAFV